MFQHKKLDKLYDVLLKDKGNKHYEELNGQTLKYFLKFYFETKDYLRVLVLATKIKEKMAGELKE